MTLQVDEDTATLYGILAGDGCLSRTGRNYSISVTGHVEEDIDFFEEVLRPLIVKLRGKPVNYRIREKYGKVEINFSDKRLFTFLKSLGFPVGKKVNLMIPETIPRDLYSRLISGYFATDGSVVLTDNNGVLYPRIEIQGKSPRILEQACNFLADNGVEGAVYEHTRSANFVDEYTIYRLQINGRERAARFSDIIGFLNPKHANKFESYLQAEVA